MTRRAGSNASTWLATIAVALLLAADAARAQDGPARDPFDKGSWVLQVNGGYAAGVAVFDQEFGSGATASAGAGYYVADDWGLYVLADGYALTHVDPETDAEGGGLSLLLRHHLWHFGDDGAATLFIESAGGLVRLDHEWPNNGTHTNFTGRIGAGGTLRLTNDGSVHLIGGIRWFHLSNGYRHGRDENPNYDAAEGWVGVLWEF